MSAVQIFWDPQGFELSSIGTTTLSGPPTDGDAPFVRTTIRMLTIDTPELHYPGNTSPATHCDKFAELATWIDEGIASIEADLAAYLKPELAAGTAGTLQKLQAEAAKGHFQPLLDEKLETASDRSIYGLLTSPSTNREGFSPTWRQAIRRRIWKS